MTVQYLSATELQRSASAATVAFSHTAPSGQKGILVGFVRGLTSGAISLVSYGGTTLVQYARATDTSTEPGAAEWWYAPHTTEGAQTVSYNQDLPGSMVHVVVVSVGGNGIPWVRGAATYSNDNTTSHSVSLTTGYVSGMAFGAYYGGAAAPSSLSYSTDRTLIHDWDFGNYYSEFFRHTAVTTSPPYLLGFGGDAPTADDVAFAAVYLTDGSVDPGVGAVTLRGLAPKRWVEHNRLAPTLQLTLSDEATLQPGVGAITAQGRAPSLSGETVALPGVGSVSVEGRAPTVATEAGVEGSTAPGVGAVTAAGRAPTLTGDTALAPDAGAVSTAGQIPTLWRALTISPAMQSEAGQSNDLTPTLVQSNSYTAYPGLGQATATGLQPALVTDGVALPGVGLVSLDGRTPALEVTLPAGEVIAQPGLGAIGAAGLAPTLTTAGVALPDTGLIGMQGRAPSLATEAVALPGAGQVGAAGQAPALVTATAVTPTATAVTTAGRVPGLYTERTITPALGSVVAGGQAPLLPEEGVGYGTPGVGLASTSGLAPTLYLERLIAPGAGTAVIEGRAPALETFAPVELTIEPGVGFVTFDGLAPSTGESIRGHVQTGRRWRGRSRYYGETSLSDSPFLGLDPTPPAPLPPEPPLVLASAVPAAEVAEIESLAGRIAELETQAARRARRRREEEELIQFLLRVA